MSVVSLVIAPLIA